MTNLKSNISHEQRKKIFAMTKQANLNSDELHSYMKEWTNTNSLSSTLCSSAQANKIITSLEAMINKPKDTKTNSPLPLSFQRGGAGGGVLSKGGATPKQLNAIKAIQRSLQWNDARLKGFIEHTVAKTDLYSLKVGEASKVIIGLRKMNAHQSIHCIYRNI